MAVVSTANGAAEKYESSVTLAGTDHLTGVPRKRCSVKCHEHQSVFRTGDEQRRIVEPQPRAVLPIRNVDDREVGEQLMACRHEPVGRVLVSQQPVRPRTLLHAICRFLLGTPWRRPEHA